MRAPACAPRSRCWRPRSPARRRHAGLLGDQQALIATALGPDLATRLHDGRLDLRGLRGWSRARRHALLRQYCAALGAPVPGAAWLAECDTSVIAAGADRQPVLQLGALRACRFDDALSLLGTASRIAPSSVQAY
ncbi:TilS substrate-binding domain-containing protein, partial [Algiphilus sp.]|uniref:TilS substrate-binding domain-containing protein n=1 Tax=Algiphilus sp. TaxID=1872431 RepID=UPI003C462154